MPWDYQQISNPDTLCVPIGKTDGLFILYIDFGDRRTNVIASPKTPKSTHLGKESFNSFYRDFFKWPLCRVQYIHIHRNKRLKHDRT